MNTPSGSPSLPNTACRHPSRSPCRPASLKVWRPRSSTSSIGSRPNPGLGCRIAYRAVDQQAFELPCVLQRSLVVSALICLSCSAFIAARALDQFVHLPGIDQLLVFPSGLARTVRGTRPGLPLRSARATHPTRGGWPRYSRGIRPTRAFGHHALDRQVKFPVALDVHVAHGFRHSRRGCRSSLSEPCLVALRAMCHPPGDVRKPALAAGFVACASFTASAAFFAAAVSTTAASSSRSVSGASKFALL
jgi:hypothetical protein